MKFLRTSIDNIKPNFIGEGKYAKWFPLFDAFENFVFNSKKLNISGHVSFSNKLTNLLAVETYVLLITLLI